MFRRGPFDFYRKRIFLRLKKQVTAVDKNESDIDELREVLKTRERWSLCVLEYGITHHLMYLALGDGAYPRDLQLECHNPIRMCGEFSGGPYRLTVSFVDNLPDSGFIELASADSSFRLVCERIKVREAFSNVKEQ
jgi:hypothetical protein